MCDQINGIPYKDIPPPVNYKFADYTSDIVNGTENGSYVLKPLSDYDMASTTHEDAAKWYLQYGKNTTRLGPEMTDRQFKDFMGQTWD